jgi:hypothetical protein
MDQYDWEKSQMKAPPAAMVRQCGKCFVYGRIGVQCPGLLALCEI